MNNILFDTQYGSDKKILKYLASEADSVLFYGGKVDYSLFKIFPNIKIIVGNNVILDLDQIHSEIKDYSMDFLKQHLLISDKAFVSLPSNSRVDAKTKELTGTEMKSVYDNKHSFTGYRLSDLSQITSGEELGYYNRNANVIMCGADIAQVLKTCSNTLFVNTDGAFLDIDTGIYPDVMPYSTTVTGAVEHGVGIKEFENIIGIVHPYAKYSGKGIMPTEFHETNSISNRLGRLDLVALKHICQTNSITSLALIDLCALDDWDEIEVCTSYKNLNYYPTDLGKITPAYEKIKGWKKPTTGMTRINDLPIEARELIGLIESHCNVMVDFIDTELSQISRWDYWA